MSRNPLLLLVDDEPDMGLIVKSLSKRFQCELEYRQDAAAAWSYLLNDLPDLLLLDVRLPGESGPALCRRLRAQARFAELPVALFTHGGVPGDVAEGLEAGAQFLVNKELVCRPAEWHERLAEILAAPRGRGLVMPVGWTADKLANAGESISSLPAIMRHPSLRNVGIEVRRVLVRRAARQAFGALPPVAALIEPWFFGEDIGRARRAPPGLDSKAQTAFASCLADQFWCLLGEAASAPVRASLMAFASELGKDVSRP